jgi:hypothetical protein
MGTRKAAIFNLPSLGGIPWHQSNPELDALEARKSNLRLEVMFAEAQGAGVEITAAKYAEAAASGERLRDACLDLNLREEAWVHGFGATQCWAWAGDLFRAIAARDLMLEATDLKPRLRSAVADLAQTLRDQRAERDVEEVEEATV